jgi:hypothetical protein
VRSDETGFAEFFQESWDPCPRAVAASTGDMLLAEDQVAEAFARAWLSWRKVSRHPAPRAWVVRTALNAGTHLRPIPFIDAAMYSSGTPSRMSTFASPRTRSAFASVGVSPTSIMIATLGRDDSAFTLGAVAAVQTTIYAPVQVKTDRDHSREAV